MVNIKRCIQFACALALLNVAVLRAKDLTAYRLGDTAEEDIVTSVAFDAIDPEATAARKAEEAMRTPVIFRDYPAMTNEVVKDFLSQYDKARKDFASAVSQKYYKETVDAQTVATADFDLLVANFNKAHKNFPITASIAKAWAQGDTQMALSIQVAFLARLGEALRRPISPDELPTDITIGDNVVIVYMKDQNEALSLADAKARGKAGGVTSFRKLNSARSIFRRAFPDDEQTTARALQNMIKPDCFVDEQLTKQGRDQVTASLAVPVHYEAGQTIVRRGEIITARTKAAIDQLAVNAAAMQATVQAQKAKQLAIKSQQAAEAQAAAAQKAQQDAQSAIQSASQLKKDAQSAHANNVILLAALGGVLVVSLLMVGTVWWLIKQRQVVPVVAVPAAGMPVAAAAAAAAPAMAPRAAPLPTNGDVAPRPAAPVAPRAPAPVRVNIAPPAPVAPVAPTPAPMARPAAVPPQPMVQEVPARAGESQLNPREAAVAEISQLVKRLDELRTPPHERVRTYEMRIEDFERELAQRGVQNPELLKLKIEALNCQIEAERKRHRLDSDWGSILN